MNILDILKFFVFLFFAVYVPGSLIVRRIRPGGGTSALLSLTMGIALVTLASFISIYLVYALIGVSLYFFVRGFDIARVRNLG